MTAHDDLRPELERLFAEYGDALGPMDAPAPAALRAMPGLMVTAEDAWRIHVAALAAGSRRTRCSGGGISRRVRLRRALIDQRGQIS